MISMNKPKNLRTILRTNAAFAALTGVSALAATSSVADAIGVSQHRFVSVTGAALIVFALQLMVASGQQGASLRRSARLISLSDFGWVAGTAGIIGLGGLGAAGNTILAAVAVIVGTFGVLQWHTAGKLESDEPQVVEISRRLRGNSEQVWALVTDHETYGRISPNLSKVVATGPDGPELTRRCWDTRGKQWDEACVLWDQGQRFIVDVDTDADDYPYPLESLRGEWRVQQIDDTHTTVTIRFELRAKPGPAGAMFAAAMTTGSRPLVRRITNAWQDMLTNDPTSLETTA